MSSTGREPESGRRALARVELTVTIIAICLALLNLLVRMVTHFPFFDEALHVHYLWLTSSGLRPEADFFCVYPVLGYILTAPYLRLFPDSAFVVLALRGLSIALAALIGGLFYLQGRRIAQNGMAGLAPYLLVVTAGGIGAYVVEFSTDHLAALAALAAIYFFLGPVRTGSLAMASALCLLSFVIMPKYTLPLFFGLLGALLGHYLQERKVMTLVLAVSAGAIGALLFVAASYYVSGISLLANIRYAHVLQYRYSAATGHFGSDLGLGPLISSVGRFVVRDPVYGAAVVFGLAGWIVQAKKTGAAATLGGWGVLTGALVMSLIAKGYLEQYVAPVLLCLGFFVPYAFLLPRSQHWRQAARLLLILGTGVVLAGQFSAVTKDFEQTAYNCREATEVCRNAQGSIDMVPPGIVLLGAYSRILRIIPPGEQVVAAWPFHPMFRRDPTFIPFDEVPSFLVALPQDDPLRRNFDPAVFQHALEANPPAGIALDNLKRNYPPAWAEVAERFIERNAGWYVGYVDGGLRMYIRRDLVPAGAGEGE